MQEEKNIIVIIHKYQIRCLLQSLIPNYIKTVIALNLRSDIHDSYNKVCGCKINENPNIDINAGSIFLFKIEENKLTISLKYDGKKNVSTNHFTTFKYNYNDYIKQYKEQFDIISYLEHIQIIQDYKQYKTDSVNKIIFEHKNSIDPNDDKKENNFNAIEFPDITKDIIYNGYTLNIFMIAECDSYNVIKGGGNTDHFKKYLGKKLGNIQNSNFITKANTGVNAVASALAKVPAAIRATPAKVKTGVIAVASALAEVPVAIHATPAKVMAYVEKKTHHKLQLTTYGNNQVVIIRYKLFLLFNELEIKKLEAEEKVSKEKKNNIKLKKIDDAEKTLAAELKKLFYNKNLATDAKSVTTSKNLIEKSEKKILDLDDLISKKTEEIKKNQEQKKKKNKD